MTRAVLIALALAFLLGVFMHTPQDTLDLERRHAQVQR